MKMRLAILLMSFFSVGMVLAQSDWNINLYQKYTIDNFKEFGAFNTKVNFQEVDYHLLHAAIFYYTNIEREKRRLPMLDYAPQLETAAFYHSKSMVEKNYFNHFNSREKKRKTPNDRLALTGAANPYAAENITEAFGIDYKGGDKVIVGGPGEFKYTKSSTWIGPHTYLSLAYAMVDGWMHSPPHKKNILAKDALQLGCGAYFFVDKNFNSMPKFKATQNFQLYEKIVKGEKPVDEFPF